MAIKWNGEKLGPGSNLNTPPATILSVAANENQGDSSKSVSKKTKKDEDDQPENVSTPACSLVGLSMGASIKIRGHSNGQKGTSSTGRQVWHSRTLLWDTSRHICGLGLGLS